MTKKNNLELWNKREKTDPNHTKKVNQRGGFTAICAQWQIKQATEEWGPYGSTWGVKETNYGTITNGEGTPLEVYLDAVFFYPGGEFPISSDTTFRAGNDSRKKLLTDVTTKALSKLGFSADVFMGLYDDNKYVSTLKEEFKQSAIPGIEEQASASGATPISKDKSQALFNSYKEGFESCKEVEEVKELIKEARDDFKSMLTYEQNKLKKLISKVKEDWVIE